jgi:hypothetical protein
VYPNQFYGVEGVFDNGKESDIEPSVKEFHAKIGQLTTQNDFLSAVVALMRGPSEMINRKAELPLAPL